MTTKQETDDMTHAELMARVIDAYDVPMTLIRYERLDTDTARHGIGGTASEEVSVNT